MFEDDSWIRTFLQNVSKFLIPGGHFIATLCDSNAIVRTIRNRSHKEGNEYVWKVLCDINWIVEFNLLHCDG